MTMDLYGHLVDDRLWEAARAVGGILGVTFGGKWQEIFCCYLARFPRWLDVSL